MQESGTKDEKKLTNYADTIRNETHVIIVDNSHQKRVYKIEENKMIEHYKSTICCNDLIGKPYNTFFLVTDPAKKDGKIEEMND